MTNTEIAEHFLLLAQLMEIQGENPFKIKSYSNASDVIEEYPRELITIADEELYQIKGIGQAVGEKVRELQHTGKIGALQNILDVVPPGVVEMLKVKGLSPKKISTLWKVLDADHMDVIEKAALENRIAPIKGFGAKTQETIRTAIAFYKKSLGYFLWAKAEAAMLPVLQALQAAFPGHRFTPVGEMRRQLDTVGAVELLTDLPADDLKNFITGLPGFRVETEDPFSISATAAAQPVFIFHLSTKETYSYRLFTKTGNDEFVAAFVQQYNVPENAASEEEIFSLNHIAFISPALRETAAIIEKAKTGNLPQLIQPGDVKSVIHCHSTYSDGAATLEQMATAARDKGYEYLVISDHSQAAQYAQGLYPDKILKQHAEIDKLNKQLHPFKIFRSIEADILADGNLDYTPEILSSFDLVIASVHSNLNMNQEKAMMRLLKAIENPFTTILGHMTGRLLLKRGGYPVDHKTIIDACVANKVVIEINANPRRLDLDWRWIAYALEKGALLSIDPDAHSVKGIDDIRFGVLAAQKGGVTLKDNLSSFTLEAFEQFLRERRN